MAERHFVAHGVVSPVAAATPWAIKPLRDLADNAGYRRPLSGHAVMHRSALSLGDLDVRRRVVSTALSALVALGLFISPALARVRGQLWLAKPPVRSTGKHSSRPPRPYRQKDVKDAVVYVEAIPDEIERKLERKVTHPGWFRKPKPPRIVQGRSGITPRVFVATIGTPVQIENRDRIYHAAFSVSEAKHFDLGSYGPGRRNTVVFDSLGVVNLFCALHSNEFGYVVVVPNHAVVRPDSLGRFSLPKLPAGSYRLHVWHPRLGELTRDLQMPQRRGERLELSYANGVAKAD